VTITARELFYATFTAGSGNANFNFRSTSTDGNTGSFVYFNNANADVINSLGKIYGLVSFPRLVVEYTPAF
jgi:hypothetical protein